MSDCRKKLKDAYKNWNDIYNNGRYDPFWADGSVLNSIRANIIAAKEECSLIKKELPEEYYLETPPKVDDDYVACADIIRKKAQSALTKYLKNQDLLFLEKHIVQLTPKERKNTCIDAVIGYKNGLVIYISEDSLVDMRRHAFHPEIYLESFSSCRKKVEKILADDTERELPLGQISLFNIVKENPDF